MSNIAQRHPAVISFQTLSLSSSPQVRPHGTTPYCSDLLTDGGCVALLVVGFLLVTPLLVLALAAYCRLARHLQLGLCFIPYSRAVYKNMPATQHRGLGTGCCGGRDGVDGSGKAKVWVWDEGQRNGEREVGKTVRWRVWRELNKTTECWCVCGGVVSLRKGHGCKSSKGDQRREEVVKGNYNNDQLPARQVTLF